MLLNLSCQAYASFFVFLAFDFCRFCVVIRFFFIPATTTNYLRLRRIFYPRFPPLHLFSYLNSICKCYWNILVTFCWFQLAKNVDRRQSRWKTNPNSWSARRVFVWCRHFLLYTSCICVLLPCVLFLKIPQNVCKSTW